MEIAEIDKSNITAMENVEFRRKNLADLPENKFPTYVKLGDLLITYYPENYNLLGLGTCLGVYMYDLHKNHFAMAHCVLPEYSAAYGHLNTNMKGKFTDLALNKMIEELCKKGSDTRNLKVKIAGGAQIYNDTLRIGSRNIEIAHKILEENSITIVAEDIGGSTGRSILAFNRNGTIQIRKEGKKYTI